MKELVEANLFSLKQLYNVLQQVEPDQYAEKLAVLSNASIGMHFRHVLEFYDLLLNCNDELCYDDRPRKLAIETDISAAQEMLNSIIRRVNTLENDRLIKLWAGYDLYSDKRSAVDSTLMRELSYNLEHCIHHMALIRVGLNQLALDGILPESFGVAPSTIRAMGLAAQSQ